MNKKLDLEFDKHHIWHPYTSMAKPLKSYGVVSAKGVKIKLENGTELIDGMSSWWSVIHGYSNSKIIDAMKNQLDKVSHVMFGGLTHNPAIKLAKKLIEITPKPLDKVFFSDSGSVAVEVALKMAIQYWFSKNKKEKSKFMTIRSGYHGDTFNAMSVCDPVTGMHDIFSEILPVNYFAPQPKCRFNDKNIDNDIKVFEDILKKNHKNIAGIIIEPIVQGAGGMWFYSQYYLKEISNLAKKYDVLLILDEIATGFGRTGKMFALEHSNIVPDILCIGKALTGGNITFAATLTTKNVAETISQNSGVFMHGPTFMANPLACSAAIASLELLEERDWQKEVLLIEDILEKELEECKNYSSVNDVRILGAIGVIEMKKSVVVSELQEEFVKRGIWVRPFGKMIYIMPPYIISKEDLTFLTDKLKEVIRGI